MIDGFVYNLLRYAQHFLYLKQFLNTQASQSYEKKKKNQNPSCFNKCYESQYAKKF